jgi:hypothetical protein
MPRAPRSIRLGLALLFLAACAGPTPGSPGSGTPAATGASSTGATPSSPTTGSSSPTSGAATPPAFAAAPAQVNLRDPLPFCGIEQSSGPGNVPDETIRRCFLDAFTEARPAELVIILTTIEGDPIGMIYRTRPGQPIEVFVDSTRDKFGSGAWETYGCTGLHEIQAGDPSGLAVSAVFQLDGCTEPRKIS